MIWQEFTLSLLLLLTAAISVATMQATWMRRRSPGARAFAFVMLCIAIWTMGAAVEHASDSFFLKIFWAQIQISAAAFIPVFWLKFTLDYSQISLRMGSWNRLVGAVLIAIPLITIFTIVSNPWHKLFWQDIYVLNEAPRLAIQYEPGIGYWVFLVYSYLLMFLGTFALGWSMVRFPNFYRRQAALLIVGAIIPWIVNLAHLFNYRPMAGADLTPLAFIVTQILFSIEIFRYHLFDLIPVALDTVVEAMSEGVMVVDDRDRVVYTNPAARKMLNWNPNNSGRIDDQIANRPEMLSILHRGETTGPQQPSTIIKVRDSPTRYLEFHIDPLHIHPTGVGGRMILMRDVTAEIGAQEQLRLQSVALAAAPYTFLITDRDGVIQWVNPAFTDLTGFSYDEAVGKTPRILSSGKHDASFYTDLWETILAGRTWKGEVVNRTKNGIYFIVEVTIAPVFASSGEITHFISIQQDVSERKELEKMRDDLVQAIVHDLRNPINTVLFSLDMLQGPPLARQIPAELLSMIEISRENAWRMLGMINSMLDLSRLESGNMPLLIESVVFAELVEQTIHSQTLIAQRREILILNNVSYDLPQVSVDRVLISRVMQNLLDNAIKFTAQGSNIEISASLKPDDGTLQPDLHWVIVSIHDDGPGIPPELRNLLFQKFSTGSSPRRGSGLGLAFCRLAVEAHHGQIWVESGPSQGTSFLFSLPAHSQSRMEPGQIESESSRIA